MSVQSQIDRINENVANTYSVLEGYGAEMPQTRNTANLPQTAADIKAVLYKEQTLTEDQKAQARSNIGAATTLSASTVDVTPSHVVQAIADGSNVILGHTDATFGRVFFTYFLYAADLGTIVSSAVILYDGNVMAVQLVGRVGEPTWETVIVNLPQQSDIPAMNKIVDSVIAALPVYGGETA